MKASKKISSEGNQLAAFDNEIRCHHCNKDPGMTPGGIWNGFLDKDNGRKCCWKCREVHYHKKAVEGQGGLYSEVPIVVQAELRYRSF